jgi:hypothetical protein
MPRMKPIFFLSLLLAGLLISGCKDSAVDVQSHPTGLWEYVGPLPDGRVGILRVSIQEGPFLKYLGFRDPGIELTDEQSAEITQQSEQSWTAAPEMLVQFSGEEFRGLGGATDGVVLFQHNPGDGSLVSFYEDSRESVFRPVESFQPFEFPVALP